jgi:hypothetical protein
VTRHPILIAAACLLCVCAAGAQKRPEQGKIKSVDVKKKAVVITSGGEDVEVTVTDKTLLKGVSGETTEEKLAGFKPGANVRFLAREQDSKKVLVGMMLVEGGGPGPKGRVSPDHSKFKPLTELGEGKYEGFQGGLYPGGKNERPEKHEKAGLDFAKKVQRLGRDGKPDDEGRIVILSIGMSNTSQISNGFLQAMKGAKKGVNPDVMFINGAQGGMTAARIQDPESKDGKRYWDVIDELLKREGLTRLQVQAVWIKQADAGPKEGFPGYPRKLQKELKNIVRVIAERFPNAKLCYLSGRTYGGYATAKLNPEPYAYQSGFAVKWLIEEQIKGDEDLDYTKGKAPWLSWGPYLWANGERKNPDGLSSLPEDFGPDGTHHTNPGARKMGEQLLKFFQADSTTRGWFGKKP